MSRKHAADIEHGRAGLLAVLWGSIVSAVFALIVETQVFAADVAQNFRVGRKGAVSGYDFCFVICIVLESGIWSVLSVGIAMLIGALIGWGWGVPHYSSIAGDFTTAVADARAKHMERKGPIHWRGRDRDFGDLDTVETGKAGDQRSGRRDGCITRA